MHKLLITAVATIAVSSIAASANAADSGPRPDVAAIHKLFAGKAGPCTQRVDKVSVRGSYALVTVVQGGTCDMAVVWVLQKRGAWRTLGAIGGVPDACSIHAKGVPLAVARPLIIAFTGSSDPSLTSTKACGG